jgi:transcriptional regulator with XRE-family HTH domain
MTTSQPVLSLTRLRRYRLQAGLSERALARATAMTGMSITALEQGRNHDELSLRHLLRIARALNVDPTALFATDTCQTVEPTPDDVAIEAALAGVGRYTRPHDLARGLGWTLSRTTDALERLRIRLANTGQRVAAQNGKVKLVPAAGVLTDAQEQAVANADTNERGLTLTLAHLLRHALEPRRTPGYAQKTNANHLLAQGALINLGLAELRDKQLVPAAAVFYGLEPADSSNRQRRRPADGTALAAVRNGT